MMDLPTGRAGALFLTVLLAAAGLRAGEIHDAAVAGDLAKVRALLEADPTLLETRGEMGNTPLISACFAPPSFIPKAEVARFLIDRGADVNAANDWGGTPLYLAVRDLDLMGRLIAEGARVNVEAFVGITPLHRAAAAGNLRVARLLIDHGARLDARSTDGTVLHEIINRKTESNAAMARLLLDSGLKLQEFAYGNTELHLAALKGQANLVPVLVDRGADVNAVNDYGHTALFYAARNGHRGTAEALLAHGAHESDIVEANYGQAPQLTAPLREGEAYLWSLDALAPATAYAVKTRSHLLLFDPFVIDASPEAGLANGCLNPAELAGQTVTVLLTRPRHPRLAPTLSALAAALPGADFVLGFEPTADVRGNGPVPPFRLATPNETFTVGPVQVSTIRATGRHTIESDSGLGYLVEADGVRVFHAGIHASDNEETHVVEYRQQIDFLKPFAPIDLAILPVNGRHLHRIAYQPYLYLIDQLSPRAIYLMAEELAIEEHPRCLEVLKARNVPVAYPEGGMAAGERFHYVRD
jgi:ankyrin repeat protein/L-ascorbate metabolism protein UlaG (beta-lactamase superfamily)